MEGNRPTIYNDNQYLIEDYKKIQQWLKEEKANFLLVKGKNNSVSFKIPVIVNGIQEYVKRTTGEKITLDGLARLKVKCKKLKDYLEPNPSLSQIIGFIDILNKEKKEIIDDRITMEEAVKKVEKWFSSVKTGESCCVTKTKTPIKILGTENTEDSTTKFLNKQQSPTKYRNKH